MHLPVKDIVLIKMNSYQYNKLVHIHHCFGSLTKMCCPSSHIYHAAWSMTLKCCHSFEVVTARRDIKGTGKV